MSSVYKKCLVSECNLDVYARGYCARHYRCLRLYGDPYKYIWLPGSPMPQSMRDSISKASKGHIKTEQHRKNLSKSLMGHSVSDEQKEKSSVRSKMLGLKPPPRTGCEPWNKGNRGLLSAEVRKSMGKSGSAHKNWKGGLTTLYKRLRQSQQYRDWRSSVFARDHYTCQKCGTTRIKIEAHHIKPFGGWIRILTGLGRSYEEILRIPQVWDIDIGITLCKDCHKQQHIIKWWVKKWPATTENQSMKDLLISP